MFEAAVPQHNRTQSNQELNVNVDAGQMRAALWEQASVIIKAHPDPLKPCIASSSARDKLLPSQVVSEPLPAVRKPEDAAGLALVPPTPAQEAFSRAGLLAGAASQSGRPDGHALAERALSPPSQQTLQPMDPSRPGARWHLLDTLPHMVIRQGLPNLM